MEAVPANLFLPNLLTSLVRIVNDLQRKNTTMINYYIHPRPIPTEIAAYEPRLLIYRTRLHNLSQLSLNHLSMLVDSAVPLLASYILPNVTQLAVASVGIQTIFIEHYDRRLEQSLPYETIHSTLRHYEQSLHQFIGQHMNNPRRLLAENFVSPPSSTIPSLCHGAIAFLNGRDHGKVSNPLPADLLPQHHGRLADRGGVVLWWECPICAFRLRYHASNSISLSINSTDEFMFEDGVEDIAFRSAWLAKCHIYHPRQPKLPVPSPPTSPRPNHGKARDPEPLSLRPKPRPQPVPKRVSFTRRKSSSHSTTGFFTATATTTTSRIVTRSPSASPPPTPRSNSKPESKSPTSPLPAGPNSLRYYCPFCIAQGKAMVGPSPSPSSSSDSDMGNEPEPTCFEESKDLLEHIDDRHTRDRPVNLLLQRLKVAVRGEMAVGPEGKGGRWDLDLR